MKLTRTIALAAVVVLGLCMSKAAFADSIWNLASGLTADAAFSTGVGNTWNLTITLNNTSGTAATVNQLTLQLFQASNVAPQTFTVDSPSTNGWGSSIDQKASNGTSTCGSSIGTNKGWLCAAGAPLFIDANRSLAFRFGGTFKTSGLNGDTLDLISNGTINDRKWAISANAGRVPEPAALGLLAVGIAAFGLFGRKLKR
jgi:hypothetical protein